MASREVEPEPAWLPHYELESRAEVGIGAQPAFIDYSREFAQIGILICCFNPRVPGRLTQ